MNRDREIKVGDLVNELEGARRAGLVTEIVVTTVGFRAKILWRDSTSKSYKLSHLEPVDIKELNHNGKKSEKLSKKKQKYQTKKNIYRNRSK